MSRLELTYRIDTNKAHEREILPIVDDLMTKRSYSRAIRVGLKIFWEALKGETTTLRAEFPQLVELMVAEAVQTALRENQNQALEQITRQLQALNQGAPTSIANNAPRPSPNRDNPDDLLEIKPKSTKPGNSGRVLLLQVWMASNVEHIKLFNTEDLELVTGHPAFNQALIEAEKARRRQAAVPSPPPSAPLQVGQSKKIKGSEGELPPPNFDDLDLL
jgi:hypothetical protein